MIKRFCSLAGALILATFVAGANAATVSLFPTLPTTNLLPGDFVSFDINIDFSAEGGTLGGGFDLTFDESQLSFDSIINTPILGDPGFARLPDYVPGSGLLESWAVGDFNGIQSGLLGQVQFSVLAGATSSLVSLGPTSGIAGPWVDFVTLVAFDPQPDYNQIEVSAVPLPAAAWLFGSALLGLAGIGRNRKKSA